MVCKADSLYSLVLQKQDSEYSCHSFISLRTSFSQTFLLTFINSFFIFHLSFLFSITPTLAGGLYLLFVFAVSLCLLAISLAIIVFFKNGLYFTDRDLFFMVCFFGCNVFCVICFDRLQDLPRFEYVPQRLIAARKTAMNKKLDVITCVVSCIPHKGLNVKTQTAVDDCFIIDKFDLVKRYIAKIRYGT